MTDVGLLSSIEEAEGRPSDVEGTELRAGLNEGGGIRFTNTLETLDSAMASRAFTSAFASGIRLSRSRSKHRITIASSAGGTVRTRLNTDGIGAVMT
jgi:hypothetical protein